MQDTVRIASRGSMVCVSVHDQPRASRIELVGRSETALNVRLQAPPVEDATNDALVAPLAARVDVARRVRRVIGSAVSRADAVESAGPTEAAVRALQPTEDVD